MAERRAPYAPEYRRQMVELVRPGRTPGELAGTAPGADGLDSDTRRIPAFG